jgi:hypothetical protein
MTAIVINKENENYNKEGKIIEIFDRFLCIKIKNKKVDYGFNEIKIKLNNDKDYWFLGQFISLKMNFVRSGIKNNEIIKAINNFSHKIKKAIAKKDIIKAVFQYIWN